MAIFLMLILFAVAIGVDYVRTHRRPIVLISRQAAYTTPGYEWMGALAQDGGELVKDGLEGFMGEGI
jgi:hypothetical protein